MITKDLGAVTAYAYAKEKATQARKPSLPS